MPLVVFHNAIKARALHFYLVDAAPKPPHFTLDTLQMPLIIRAHDSAKHLRIATDLQKLHLAIILADSDIVFGDIGIWAVREEFCKHIAIGFYEHPPPQFAFSKR